MDLTCLARAVATEALFQRWLPYRLTRSPLAVDRATFNPRLWATWVGWENFA